MTSSTTTLSATSDHSYFLRGFFFGTITLLLLQAFLAYRFVSHLLDPNKRLTKVSSGDRPSFANDFSGVTGKREGSTDRDHEILKDELLLSSSAAGAAAKTAHKPTREHNEPWPEDIVEFLRVALTPDPEHDTPLPPPRNPKAALASTDGGTLSSVAPTEQCRWINVLAHRFFLALRGSELFKNKAKAKWTEKINAKLKGNSFVSHVEIVDISLGDHAPKILGVRLLKGMSEDLAVSMELDMSYNGGGSIAIQTTLVGGLKLPVRVHVSGLAGKLRLRCPSIQWPDMLGLAFVDDPGTTFRVDSPLTVGDNELLRGMVNKLLSSVVRKVFLELWVLPSWRTFFMPLMEPKIEDILARQQAHKDVPTPAARSKHLATKASTLWESRSPLLRNGKAAPLTGDIFGHNCFSTDLSITCREPDYEVMGTKLVDGFIKYVREKSTAASFPPSITVKPDDISELVALASDAEPASDPNSSEASGVSPAVATAWKTVRNRNNIHVEKKRVLIDANVAELTRASITMHCDTERVFSVLSNPEHNRHVEDAYLGSEILHQFDDAHGVRKTKYKFGRHGTREFTAFLTKKKISTLTLVAGSTGKDSDSSSIASSGSTNAKPAEYVVVFRSISNFHDAPDIPPHPLRRPPSEATMDKLGPTDSVEDASTHSAPALSTETKVPSIEIHETQSEGVPISTSASMPVPAVAVAEPDTGSKVFVYGYLISPDESSPSDTCHVTVLSQMSAELSRLEVSYDACRKLKTFIEELASLSGLPISGSRDGRPNVRSSASSGTLRKRRFFSDSSAQNVLNPSTLGSSLSNGGVDVHGRKMEKLKSLVGSTAGYLIKSRRVAGWLGKHGQPSFDAPSPSSSTTMDADESTIFSTISETPSTLESEFDDTEKMDFSAMPGFTDEDGSSAIVEEGDEQDVSADSEGTAQKPSKASSFRSLPEMSFSGDNLVEDSEVGDAITREEEAGASLSVASERSALPMQPPALPPRTLRTVAPSPSPSVSPLKPTIPAIPPSDLVSPVERLVPPREKVEIEIRHAGSKPDSHSQLTWSFTIASGQTQTPIQNQSIAFSVLFLPDAHLSGASLAALFPCAPYSQQHQHLPRAIVPPMTAHAPPQRPASGSFPVGGFPDGRFLFVFDNSGEKRVARKVVLDVAVHKSGTGKEKGSAMTLTPQLELDVAIPRKQTMKVPFLLDQANEGMEVCYEMTVQGGYEIGFGVLFRSDKVPDLDEDETKGIRPRRDLSSEEDVERDAELETEGTSTSTPAVLAAAGVDPGLKNQESYDDLANVAQIVSNAALSGVSSYNTNLVAVEDSSTPSSPPPTSSSTSTSAPSTTKPTPAPSSTSTPTTSSSYHRQSLSSRLAAAVTGSNSHTAKSEANALLRSRLATSTSSTSLALLQDPDAMRQTELVVLAKMRGHATGTLPAVSGMYTFVWDNSQAVVVGRRVGVRVWVVQR
ncbi:PDZ domain-containing protein 8 [Thoreauomyces humboldtii]|nr:PDZ domain-containing protein 8 [Thoreauomyces humboldtii]